MPVPPGATVVQSSIPNQGLQIWEPDEYFGVHLTNQ